MLLDKIPRWQQTRCLDELPGIGGGSKVINHTRAIEDTILSILRRKILSNEWIHNQCRIDWKGGETENASTSGKWKVNIQPDTHSGQNLAGDTAHLQNVCYNIESTEIHKCWKGHAMELLIIQIIYMMSDVPIFKLSIYRKGYTYHRTYLFYRTNFAYSCHWCDWHGIKIDLRNGFQLVWYSNRHYPFDWWNIFHSNGWDRYKSWDSYLLCAPRKRLDWWATRQKLQGYLHQRS